MGLIKEIAIHYANLLRGLYDNDEVDTDSLTPIYDQLEREWVRKYGTTPIG